MAEILPTITALIRDELVGSRPDWTFPDLTEQTEFERDLFCNAIDMVCIACAVEEAFGVLLPAERLEACETIGALAELVGRG